MNFSAKKGATFIYVTTYSEARRAYGSADKIAVNELAGRVEQLIP